MTEAADTSVARETDAQSADAPAVDGAARQAEFHEALTGRTPTETHVEVSDAPAPAQEAKVLLELRKEQQARKALEAETGALKPKYEQQSKLLEQLAKDPIAALKHAGFSAQKFIDAIIEKKIAPQAEYPPEIQALLDENRTLKAQQQERQRLSEQEAARVRGVAAIKAELPDYADKYPISTTFVTPETLHMVYEENQGELGLDEILSAAEQAHVKQITATLCNPKALAALAKDPNVLAALQQMAAAETRPSRSGPTRSSNGAPAQNPLTTVTARQPADDPDRDIPLSERMQGAVAAANRLFSR